MFLLKDRKKEIDNSLADRFANRPIKYLSIIFNPESEIPYDHEHKYKYYLTRIFRDFYAILVAFIILFSFINFYLQRNFSEINSKAVKIFELFTFIFLIFDMIIHIVTYPARDTGHDKISRSIFSYFFTGGFWISVITILPSLYVINLFFGTDYKILEAFKAFKFLRILRLIMLLNMFSAFASMSKAFKNDRAILFNIILFVVLLLFLFSLTVWYTESQWVIQQAKDLYIKEFKELNPGKDVDFADFAKRSSFWIDKWYATSPAGSSTIRSFSEALYFSAITLTTIGYGDFTPKSPFSRMIVPVISIVGIAIIAIPGGVISATLITSLKEAKPTKKVESEQSKNDEKAQDEVDSERAKLILKEKKEILAMLDKEIEKIATKIIENRENNN
ncbi:potassium channel family protein [Mycoplasmopsis felifaucium]|uniref:Ion transporter n=1 Tax=Mycoplasmopsis felifaucium TaxID=35768 RepID=A0ABZ2RR39_9BACT